MQAASLRAWGTSERGRLALAPGRMYPSGEGRSAGLSEAAAGSEDGADRSEVASAALSGPGRSAGQGDDREDKHIPKEKGEGWRGERMVRWRGGRWRRGRWRGRRSRRSATPSRSASRTASPGSPGRGRAARAPGSVTPENGQRLQTTTTHAVLSRRLNRTSV